MFPSGDDVTLPTPPSSRLPMSSASARASLKLAPSQAFGKLPVNAPGNLPENPEMIYRHERLHYGSLTVNQADYILKRCSQEDHNLMIDMFENDGDRWMSIREWLGSYRWQWLNEKIIPKYCPVKGEVVMIKDDN